MPSVVLAQPTKCDDACSVWDATKCDSSGYKTRSCEITTIDAFLFCEEKRQCDPDDVPCTYTYGDWDTSQCSTTGIMRRTHSVTSPGCIEYPPAVNLKTCPTCAYTYDPWGDCSPTGIQTRTYAYIIPLEECFQRVLPTTQQTCTYIPPIANPQPDKSISEPQPKPAPESVLSPENLNQSNFNDRTSNDWQKYYFGSENCQDINICSGLADPDNDGLNNNEEYRFGTNPKDSDTDNDGYLDGDEILRKTDPLMAPSDEKSDKMVFESPIEKGKTKKELLKITNVEMVKIEESKIGIKIIGKSLPSTFITLYVYSDPIILTIKTDSEGNWSYILSEPLADGKHQTYIALTDNTGKITAKSEPVWFIKTAEAATMIIPNKEISPTKSWFMGNYLIYIILGITGIILTLLSLGLIINSIKKQKEEDQQ